MIIREDSNGLILINQHDHARLCGVMAHHWRTGMEPRANVAIAAEMHDDGWKEWDAAPRLNPETGRPYTYLDIPIEDHLEIYRRGIQRVIETDLYAGLMVSLHGSLLYSRFRDGQPGAREFLEEQSALRQDLLEELSTDWWLATWIGDNVVETNRDLLFAWDTLSLILCLDDAFVKRIEWPRSYSPELGPGRKEARIRRGDRGWILDPYPFTQSPLVFRVPARRIEGTRFEDEPALQRALADALPMILAMEVARRPRSPKPARA